jgi:hypothetical protein
MICIADNFGLIGSHWNLLFLTTTWIGNIYIIWMDIIYVLHTPSEFDVQPLTKFPNIRKVVSVSKKHDKSKKSWSKLFFIVAFFSPKVQFWVGK